MDGMVGSVGVFGFFGNLVEDVGGGLLFAWVVRHCRWLGGCLSVDSVFFTVRGNDIKSKYRQEKGAALKIVVRWCIDNSDDVLRLVARASLWSKLLLSASCANVVYISPIMSLCNQ